MARKNKRHKTEYRKGLGSASEPSMFLTEQLTTVSKSKLRSYAGHITDADAMNRIETAVISQLHLERRYQECL